MWTYPGYLPSIYGKFYLLFDKFVFDCAIMDYYDAIYMYSFNQSTLFAFEIVCTLASFIATLLVIAIPFLVVWRVIKLFIGR